MQQTHIIKNLEGATFRTQQVIPVGHAGDHEFIADEEHGVRINCVRESGVVRRIDVHCHCGQTISLLCDYDDDVS